MDWRLSRDWASIFGGASIKSFTGPDYTSFGCGPDKAIDQTLGNGWGSDSIDSGGLHITPEIVVQLPTSITVTQFAIDPANTCGDDATASTKDYRVETSADGLDLDGGEGGHVRQRRPWPPEPRRSDRRRDERPLHPLHDAEPAACGFVRHQPESVGLRVCRHVRAGGIRPPELA